MRRVLPAVAGVLVVLAVAAPSAEASAHTHPPEVQLAGPGSRSAGDTLPPNVRLQTLPVHLTAHGVRYEMYLSADTSPHDGPDSAFMDVFVQRLTHDSAQVYDYALVGRLRFTWDSAALAGARLKSSDGSTQIDLSYTASGPEATSSCALLGGGRGTVRSSQGTVSVPEFRLATRTAYFGTVTVKPVSATLAFDPGCRRDVRPFRQCPGTETVATIGHGPTFATGEDYDKDTALQSVWNVSNAVPTYTLFEGLFARVAGSAALPPPVIRAGGATAVVNATGDALESGTATFHSSSPPQVSKNRHCRASGVNLTYTNTEYTGRLVPDPTAPLTGLFDAGSLQLVGHRALLDLAGHYTG